MVLNISEMDCVEMIAYNKLKKQLKKIYIHFHDIIQYAADNEVDISHDRGMSNLFNKYLPSNLLYLTR